MCVWLGECCKGLQVVQSCERCNLNSSQFTILQILLPACKRFTFLFLSIFPVKASKDTNTSRKIRHVKYPAQTSTDNYIHAGPCCSLRDPPGLWCKEKAFFIHVTLTSGIVTEDLARHFLLTGKKKTQKTAAVPLPLLPFSPPSLPSLIMPNDTRPHHRKIHSHRSPRPAAVATIILEEETLAINYMCAFHLLFSGGKPCKDLGGDKRDGVEEERRPVSTGQRSATRPLTVTFNLHANKTE